MDLENDLSAGGNEDLGFLCNSLTNKANVCLWSARGLAGSGSVMNEAKQFSKSLFRSVMGEINCLFRQTETQF